MARSKLPRGYWALLVLLVAAVGAVLFSLLLRSGEQAPSAVPPPTVDTSFSPPPSPPANGRHPRTSPPVANERRPRFTTVDEAIAGMEWGNIVFNVPGRLQLGESHTIQLLLSPSQTVEELREHIREDENIRDSRIRVSSIMHADLQGTAFSILPITPEVQAISSTEATEWRWEIRGTNPGSKQRLYLTLYAIFEVNGRETPRSIRTFEEVIEIDVTLSQQISDFVGKNWQWLWTALFLPFAGWIWERWKNTRSSDRKRLS